MDDATKRKKKALRVDFAPSKEGQGYHELHECQVALQDTKALLPRGRLRPTPWYGLVGGKCTAINDNAEITTETGREWHT